MAIAARPPRRSISSATSSPKYVVQSHITKRSPWGTSSARWPMASQGSVPTPRSSLSSRSSLRGLFASSSKVVHGWPPSGTYWRSSVQIGQRSGGWSESGNWAAQVGQTKRGMARRVSTHSQARDPAEDRRCRRRPPCRVALAQQAGSQQRGDDDRRLAARRDDADRREGQRDEHEDVGEGAEEADGEDRAAVVGERGPQARGIPQRGRRGGEPARELRAPVIGDRGLGG